jgi:hypothetical protein
VWQSYTLSSVSSLPYSAESNGCRAFGLSIHWCDALWSRFVLCAFASARMGGACAWICVERGLGTIVVVTPVVVEAWTPSWWNDRGHVESYHGSHAPVHCVWSCPSHHYEWVLRWGSTWLLAVPEGLTRPSSKAEVCQGGRALPCLRGRGQARWRLFPTGRRGQAR